MAKMNVSFVSLVLLLMQLHQLTAENADVSSMCMGHVSSICQFFEIYALCLRLPRFVKFYSLTEANLN